MVAKVVAFDENARRGVERGMSRLADVVKVSLGPKGQNVVIEKKRGAPAITSDGVSVAREIEFEDPWVQVGAELVTEVAKKTDDVAGDGTTTATVLAQVVVREGLRSVAAGANPTSLKRGIDTAVVRVTAELARMAVAVREPDRPAGVTPSMSVVTVATAFAGDSATGELIAEAMSKVGSAGVVTIEESHAIGLELDLTEGMRFDRGYISHYFVTDPERMEAVLDDPYVLVANSRISAISDLLPLLEQVVQADKPLVIIAQDVEGEALSTLVVNKIRGVVSSVAVRAPGSGDRRRDVLGDLAILTGGQIVGEDGGPELGLAGVETLGRARRVVVTAGDTTIVGGAGDRERISGRIDKLRAEMENAGSDYDREQFRERMVRLAEGVAVIKVGAATEPALRASQDPRRGRGARRQSRSRRGRGRWRRSRAGPGGHRGVQAAWPVRR